jgi:uncharacterized protein RhaS with RHS repeats
VVPAARCAITYDVTSTYRLLTDHLGSPRLVVNTSDGTIAQRMDYDEFGRILLDTSPGFQPYYDPATERWTAKESLGFGGRSGPPMHSP